MSAGVDPFGPLAGDRPIDMSVVVPTYRRFDLLNRCLTALCEQTFDPARYEIIVADDDAEERRSALLREWLERKYGPATGHPCFRYVPVTRTQGPAGARNAGWRQARGGVIAFTDDDTIPDRAWLSSGWAAMAEGWDAVAGRIRMPLPSQPTDYERDASGLAAAEFATANCFVRRAALEAVGGFDERFTAAWREDSDLQFSLLERGFSCGLAPKAVVVHPIRRAAWGVSVSQQRKIRFDALLFKKHGRLYRERIRSAPPWRYYAIAGTLVTGTFGFFAASPSLAASAWLSWMLLTAHFCVQRLARTSRSPSHVLEMAVTSIVVPPVAVFWRLAGAVRHRVLFL
jgi:GT2 family glycosyltransferase